MPNGFYIGPLYIYFYGPIIMLGVLAAAFLADREAKRRGEDPENVWNILTWVVIGGIIGARIWHILTPPASMVAQGITPMYYLTHPLDALNIRRGGLGIPGAVIAGALVLLWYTRRHHLSFGVWVDIIAPGLALAQAIGRWGNFFNREVYGAPTNLPWAIYIEPQYRLPGFQDQAMYHPLFLYESIWNLLNMGLLLWIGRKFKEALRPGDVFLTYLIVYPIGRFFLEYLRLDTSPVAGINANQTLMGIVAIAAAAILFIRHRRYSVDLENVVVVDDDEAETVEGAEPTETVEEGSSNRVEVFDAEEPSTDEDETK